MRLITLVLLVLVAGGCSRNERAVQTETRRDTAPLASVVAIATPSATVFPSSTASAAPKAAPNEDLVHQQLRSAKITALEVSSWSRPGFFRATVERPRAEGSVEVPMMLALQQQPTALRKPLAVTRLAWALGFHVVPATIVRQVSTAELGAAAATDAQLLAYLSTQAAIQNDGTIDALVMAPSCGDAATAWQTITRRDVDFDKAAEPRSWARAAASLEPLPGENTKLLRDYVEVLVLDYLAENGSHRGVLVDDATSTMMITEIDGAFPSKHFPHIENRLLEALKPVLRFPRGLRAALTQFDRARAREVFLSGTFDTWILSPRTLILIDERRLSLLTLLEARIAEYGEQAVLTL